MNSDWLYEQSIQDSKEILCHCSRLGATFFAQVQFSSNLYRAQINLEICSFAVLHSFVSNHKDSGTGSDYHYAAIDNSHNHWGFFSFHPTIWVLLFNRMCIVVQLSSAMNNTS